MFIVFYIIIITTINVNSKAFNEKHTQQFDFIDNILLNNETAPEPTHKHISSIPKYKTLLEDLNKITNLKVHVFDKMLSDEMLLMKQSMYDKDITNRPQVNFSVKNQNIASTPTLEIKQKWPIDKILFKSKVECEENINYNETHREDNITVGKYHLNHSSSEYHLNHSSSEYYRDRLTETEKKKVVGVRSFTDRMKMYLTTVFESTTKRCSCTNKNIGTVCSHRCTASSHQYHKCTHTSSLVPYPLCSRTLPAAYTFYPYYTYPSYYYVELTNEETGNSQHSHKKHEKKKRPYTYEPRDDDYMDRNYDERDESNENFKRTTKREKHKYIIDYDGDDTDKVTEKHKFYDNGYVHVDKDNLIDNLVNDLKVYYNDAVIKDCYCASWSNMFQSKYFIMYTIILVIIFL